MTCKKYFVTHSCKDALCDSISKEKDDGSFEELSYQDIVDKLNEQEEEILRLKKNGSGNI